MEYYSIFPFPQDREDFRMARILEAINNHLQSLGYKNKHLEFFLPDYLGTKVDNVNSTEREQIQAEIAFATKYEEAMRRVKGA